MRWVLAIKYRHIYTANIKEKKKRNTVKRILLTDLRYALRQLLSRLKMLTFLHFTVFLPGICYCGNCKIRSKVTKVQTRTNISLFFTGSSLHLTKKMEVNRSQFMWRWMTISLISVDNPSQNMLLHFIVSRGIKICIKRFDSLAATTGEKLSKSPVQLNPIT